MAARLPVRRSPAGRVGAALLHALATLLLLWQALVTPAHWHAGDATPAGVAAAAVAHSSTPTRPDQPADCPICRQIAQAGAYLTPGGTAVPAPLLAAETVATIVPAASRIATASHAWRSRAPPVVAA